MNKEQDNYEPYGPEWEAELMKLPKKFIIELYRTSCQKRKEAEAATAWIPCSERFPDFIEGKDYSENVFTMCNGFIGVMAFTKQNDLETDGYYTAWANCYGDINGEPEYDDDYYPTHWKPLDKTPPNP